jgi:hypothetical protein
MKYLFGHVKNDTSPPRYRSRLFSIEYKSEFYNLAVKKKKGEEEAEELP